MLSAPAAFGIFCESSDRPILLTFIDEQRNMIHSKPFPDFSSAALEALKLLYERMGFGLWMVTRTEGEDWIVLQAEDHGYGVKNGDVFKWTDSFCSRMVQGLGPCIAPNSNSVAAYANAPIGRQVSIGSYVGIPLEDADGQLFGTLCAIDPQPKPESIESELPMIRFIGRLLSTCLAAELKVASKERLQQYDELRSTGSLVDKATGALLPSAWQKVVHSEDSRCQRFGHPAYVIRIKADEGDPNFATTVASVLRHSLNPTHTLARTGDHEFLLLLPECDAVAGEAKRKEIESQLAKKMENAQISGLARNSRNSLEDAIQSLVGVAHV